MLLLPRCAISYAYTRQLIPFGSYGEGAFTFFFCWM